MSVVRINAIEVPEGMGPMLEERFAKRLGAVDQQEGFEGLELLRPTGEAETRYFVVTHWRTAEDFDAWVNSPAFGHGHAGPPAGHGGDAAPPVAAGSSFLEVDVVSESNPGRFSALVLWGISDSGASAILQRPGRRHCFRAASMSPVSFSGLVV